MMRLLLDTNIVLDVLLARIPWVESAQGLWLAHDEGRFTLLANLRRGPVSLG